jgi:hypothetical protein
LFSRSWAGSVFILSFLLLFSLTRRSSRKGRSWEICF